jgi:hypothetical protein
MEPEPTGYELLGEGAVIDPTRFEDRLMWTVCWFRLGGGQRPHPHDFEDAKTCGLLAQDPVWRTTEEGERYLAAWLDYRANRTEQEAEKLRRLNERAKMALS